MQASDILAILSLIVNVILAVVVAKVYGDVAGTKLIIAHEEGKAVERRQRILAALHAQVESLPRINTHNRTATDRQAPPGHLLPVPYPVAPFETAIFSENGISASDETIQATTDYLLKARELNVLIEALQSEHLSSIAHGPQPANKVPTQQFVYDQAETEMPNRIESLKKCIEGESREGKVEHRVNS